MKKSLILLVLTLLVLTACGPRFNSYDISLDNRTNYTFQVYVDEYRKGTLEPGAIAWICLLTGPDRMMQLRAWDLFGELIIVSFPIDANLQKAIITLNKKGGIQLEFIGKGWV